MVLDVLGQQGALPSIGAVAAIAPWSKQAFACPGHDCVAAARHVGFEAPPALRARHAPVASRRGEVAVLALSGSSSWLRSAAAAVAVASALLARRRRHGQRLRATRVVLRGGQLDSSSLDGVAQPFFEPHAKRIKELLVQRLGLEEDALPEHLASRSGGKGDAAQISSYIFKGTESSPVRRFRMVLVRNGNQLQAFNAVLYPKHGLGPLPVLGVDLLSFNNHQRLLFGADWAPMLTDAGYAQEHIVPYLAEVRAKSKIPNGVPSGKFYGEEPEFFSPEMFFSRPDGPEVLLPGGDLWMVFEDYCRRYGDMLEQAAVSHNSSSLPCSSGETALAQERQCAFDSWHVERDPAVKIFMKLFGEEWTEEYLRTVLFPGAFVREAQPAKS